MSSSSRTSDALAWLCARSRRADPNRGVLRALKDPFRLVRHTRVAIRGVRAHGREAERRWGLSPGRQLATYLPMSWRHGHSIDEFYYYQLGSAEWRPHAAAFLPARRMRALERLYPQIGVDVGPLVDKGRFARRCAAAGLPAVPTLLELDADGERRCASAPGGPRFPGDLILKPRDGVGGAEVRAYDKVAGGHRDATGDVLGEPALLERWRAEARRHPLIVQPRLRNAPEVAAVSTGALCTVRLVTTRRGSEPAVPLFALLRMPTIDTVADNLYRGGLCAPIDLRTGELGPAWSLDVSEVLRRTPVARHPATGEPIAGRRLSGWDALVDLAIRAHDRFDPFHSIGWDIAITVGGPVLIEGNHNWGVMIAQYPLLTPLGWTRLPGDIRARVESAPDRPRGRSADRNRQPTRSDIA